MAAKPQKMPKVAKVKDKSPAEMQITAEQLLREAKERELEIVPPPPKQKISDPEELKEYKLKKRRAFEDNIRKNKGNISNWLKYSKWEEEQQEIQRARSLYERALDVEHRNITLWLKYAEMEMKSRQVNHARNIWDRAVTILPRVSQFWYKYTYMEEMLKNVAGAREVFERWMKWEPDEQAWQTYIKFELRYKELDRARQIHSRFVFVHPEPKNWIKYCKFEESNGYIRNCRSVFERAVQFFGDDHMEEGLMVAFAKFEEGQKEHERARGIYKYGLEHLDSCPLLRNEYTKHEKKHGDSSAIDDVIANKRRVQYKEALAKDRHDYDTWFDFVRMMEAEGDVEATRETYERAIECVPPHKEKKHWRRYIFLWIYYAVYEETVTKDMERAKDVYKMALQLVPHKLFTFAELWLLFAKFLIRRKDLAGARKTLGQAIGMCPKHKLFRGYIQLEIKLREFERCRKLYEKWLLFDPENWSGWTQFASLETMLGDHERTRSIYELAVKQPRMDMPEYLWKAYIDSEVEQEEWVRVRALYERLLQKTRHVKVWLSYAKTEQNVPDHGDRVRNIYAKANNVLRSCTDTEQRIKLLDAWRAYEEVAGTEASLGKVLKLMPRKVTKRKQIVSEDGSSSRWEEGVDFVFPDDGANKPTLLLMAKAAEWKRRNEEKERADADTGDNGSLASTDGTHLGVKSPQTSDMDGNMDIETSGTEVELTEEELMKKRMIQRMFDSDVGADESGGVSDPNLDKDSSSTSSDDSDDSDEESKKDRIRRKMEQFRAMQAKEGSKDAQEGSTDDGEKMKQRILQRLKEKKGSEATDPNLDRDDSDVEIDSASSGSDSSDSDSSDDEKSKLSKKERIRQKMEMFRAAKRKREEGDRDSD